jgi:DNA-binding transcriptional LysR family regulator
MPDLRSLDIFVSVVQHGSLSRAAAEHQVSQPSVSTRIRRLEKALDVQLLMRSSTGTQPTEVGLLVSAWASSVLNAASELVVGLETLQSQGGLRLHIASSLTIAEHLLPHWLTQFHRTHAGTAVELDVANSTRVVELVREGQTEVGFIESRDVPNGLRWRDVAADRLVVIVAADHPWSRRRTPLSVRHLVTEALVTREPGSGTREVLERELQSSGGVRQPPPILELGSTAAVKAAVMDGAGPAVLSELAVADEVRNGRLVVVETDGLHLARRLRAIWREGVALSVSATILLDQLVEQYAREQAGSPTPPSALSSRAELRTALAAARPTSRYLPRSL